MVTLLLRGRGAVAANGRCCRITPGQALPPLNFTPPPLQLSYVERWVVLRLRDRSKGGTNGGCQTSLGRRATLPANRIDGLPGLSLKSIPR